MPNKIQIRRGVKSAMPQGSAGEPLWASDTKELYMGTGSGNVNMSGSHWYRGTAMSGTSTTANQYSYSACPEVKLDDIYMNTSNGNIYACTTAGKGNTAKWTYQGCIKGTTGSSGVNGKGISSSTVTYATSSSGTTTPSSWQSTIPSVNAGSYLWTRLVITYTDNTTSTSYSVARQGSNATVTIDSALSSNSTNPVQNKVIKEEFDRREIIAANQNELHNALSSLRYIGGTIILKSGNYTLNCAGEFKNITLKGFGKGVTTLGIDNYSPGSTGYIAFYDMTVNSHFSSAENNAISLDFFNCSVNSGGDAEHLYHGSGNVKFINCDLVCSNKMGDGGCACTITNVNGVLFVGCNIKLNSGTKYKNGADYNLIYRCTNATFVGTRIICEGENRCNIVYTGDIDFNGGSIILGNAKHSISHYDSDTSAENRLVGVYIEYYKTYAQFASISGCTFNHKATGSSTTNQMILQCSTVMTGNHFKGSAVYIDGQSKKHIIDRNLSDNGITVGNAASGSVTTNNITY